MTTTEKKAYLRKHMDCADICADLQDELKMLKEGFRPETGSEAEAALRDLEKRIDQEICESVKTMEEIKAKINTLDKEKERRVLILRYIMFMDWNSIAERMGYEIRNVTNIHGSALQHLRI